MPTSTRSVSPSPARRKPRAHTKPTSTAKPSSAATSLVSDQETPPLRPLWTLTMEEGPLDTNEVFDEVDQATNTALRIQDDVQARARQAFPPEFHAKFDGEHCIACDDPIPPARLRLQRIRCASCQEDVEIGRLR